MLSLFAGIKESMNGYGKVDFMWAMVCYGTV